MDLQINDFIKNKNAIVIEDDVAIAQLLKIHLTQIGFQVEVCHQAETAYVQLQKNSYSLCLLDWMLPQVQGIDFLKKVRPSLQHTKIMMVTAKADSESIVTGLDSGADDYLTKPFDAKVLSARVRQLMRQLYLESNLQNQINLHHQSLLQKTSTSELSFDGLNINLDTHVVMLDRQEVHLTPSEFKLLVELFKAKGKVLTRDALIDLIQGQDVSVTGRTIDTHIFALRKKIGVWSKHIETIRGVGYRILISVNDISEPEVL